MVQNLAGAEDLFATNDRAQLRGEYLDGGIPILLVDNIYRDPHRVREAALSLPYSAADTHYPGVVASYPADDPSLALFLRKIFSFVTNTYLPRLPRFPDGRQLPEVRTIGSDFAIVNTEPSDLKPFQSRPHLDPFPIFGLVYLNEEDRGGTLFFKRKGEAELPRQPAYQTASDDAFEVCGRIAGEFNRLAIYPGFVFHSGEIGDWINTDGKSNYPRLTQRIMFSS